MDLAGGCACGVSRFKLTAGPLIVHACHCRDCQRLTGSAFVTNIWIEKKFVEALSGTPKSFKLNGGSGKPHEVFFCDKCGTYLWKQILCFAGRYLVGSGGNSGSSGSDQARCSHLHEKQTAVA